MREIVNNVSSSETVIQMIFIPESIQKSISLLDQLSNHESLDTPVWPGLAYCSIFVFLSLDRAFDLWHMIVGPARTQSYW